MMWAVWTAEDKLHELSSDTGPYSSNWLTNEQRNELEKSLERESSEYGVLKEKITKNVRRAGRIAYKNGASINVISYPAPAVGGPVLQVNLFDAILIDYS